MKPSPLTILLLLLTLAACNRDDNQTKLLEQQRNALDKAKAVDTTVQKQAQDLQQSLNKQAGNNSDQPAQP